MTTQIDALPTEFEWDKGNENKNWEKHQVSNKDCEQVFFNRPLKIFEDLKHSQIESRFAALGKTDTDRRLIVIFTIRGGKIRVISARQMSRKERKLYEQKK